MGNYNETSIVHLSEAQGLRNRPETMLDQRGLGGMQHTVTEMVGNALDELPFSEPKVIKVVHYKDFSVSVRDYGRGVPLGWNLTAQKWNWDLVYCTMFAGGKYGDEDATYENIDTMTYKFPIGTNGLGAFATQATSRFFKSHSYRKFPTSPNMSEEDAPLAEYFIEFERGTPLTQTVQVRTYENGVFTYYEPEYIDTGKTYVDAKSKDVLPVLDVKWVVSKQEATTEEVNWERGTLVIWKPDREEVFIESHSEDVGFDWIVDTFKETANLKECDFEFTDEVTGYVKEVKGKGVHDILEYRTKDYLLEKGIIRFENTIKGSYQKGAKTVSYIAKADILLGFVDGYKSSSIAKRIAPLLYHNSIKMLRGTPAAGYAEAIRKFFTEQAKLANLKIEESDYTPYITGVICTFSTNSAYEGQVKNGVSSSFLYELVYDLVYSNLKKELGKGNKQLQFVISRIMEAAAIRIATKEIEKNARLAKKTVNKGKLPLKFAECKTKDADLAELWIPEGESAQGACISARNSDFQAISAIMGKILNCLKAPIDKVLKNDIILDLFTAFGTGMDLPGSNFNINKLRYKKIIIATDADVDGYQIRVLLFLMFYVLAPELLRQGFVYIAETPLFEVMTTMGTFYAYNKKERDALLLKYNGFTKAGGMVTEVKRNKGLGESDADMLWHTTMCPETRRLTQLTIDKADTNVSQIIDTLFGKDTFKARKPMLLEIFGSSELADVLDSTEELEKEVVVEEEILISDEV